MTIDEHIKQLIERARVLATTAERHHEERQTDTENITALRRIAESHERRPDAHKPSQP